LAVKKGWGGALISNAYIFSRGGVNAQVGGHQLERENEKVG
jgi:hypothetical protein